MGDEGAKVTGIRQIVRLRELLQKWQAMALGPKAAAGEERPKSMCLHCESDEEYCCCCQSPDAPPDVPPDVPRGYCPVYVGLEQRRFVIPTSYLSLPVFRLLLEKAEEEFGFDHKGALTIPCETETFKYILQCMERHAKGLIDDEGNPTGMEE